MQLIVKEPATWLVRLKPFAIDHYLRYRSLSYSSNQLFGSRGVKIDVDFVIDNVVRIEKLLCRAAVSAPGSRINLHLHTIILTGRAVPSES